MHQQTKCYYGKVISKSCLTQVKNICIYSVHNHDIVHLPGGWRGLLSEPCDHVPPISFDSSVPKGVEKSGGPFQSGSPFLYFTIPVS